MIFDSNKLYNSHGSGFFAKEDFNKLGQNVIFENNVLVFHPENIEIGNNVYVGHNTILKGYYKSKMLIGDDTWIGQACFFHSAGGISIGRAVGIGPGVKILTSEHKANDLSKPILFSDLDLAPVVIKDGTDIGIGSIILPGVEIGEGVIVGAGSVVTKDVEDYTVVAGSPAKLLRLRNK